MAPPSRADLVLAAMSPARCAGFQPVQVQKLFFLIDEKLSSELGKSYFAFAPYDYGPFDKDVYVVLEELESKGLVRIGRASSRGGRVYNLTEAGQARGTRALEQLDQRARNGIETLSKWVHSMSFADLVSAIYKAYPDMKINSVFSE